MTDRNSDKIKALFNNIAPVYDRNNNIISLFTHKIIKIQAINLLPNELPQNIKILDICCGIGDLTKMLAEKYKSEDVTGCDFSSKMLNLAREKYKNIKFIEADCLNLPFDNDTFDIITVGFGLRNTSDYDKAIAEISRILKPNGLFLHLDFSKNAGFADIIFSTLVLIINKIQKNNSYKYLLASRNEFLTLKELTEKCASYGLKFKINKNWINKIINAQIYQKEC